MPKKLRKKTLEKNKGPVAPPPKSKENQPLTEPLIAAFEFGRLSNRLSFFLQQACFFSPRLLKEGEGKDTFKELRIVQGLLVPQELRDQVHRETAGGTTDLIKTLESECYFDFIREEEDFVEREGPGANPKDRRGSIVDLYISPILNKIRESVVANLEPWANKVLRLGEIVDRGLCRNNIYLFMDNDDPFIQPIETPLCVRNTSLPLLAPYVFWPGGLPPEISWFGEVRQSWAEAGLPTPLPQEFIEAEQVDQGNNETGPNIEQVVSGLIRMAHSSLGSLAPHGEQPTILSWSRPVARGVGGKGPQPSTTANFQTTWSSIVPFDIQDYRNLLGLKEKMVTPKEKYIGESIAILKVFERINKLNLADANSPMLILGPSGAGKTEIARIIHENSERKEKPFRAEHASSTQGNDFNIPGTQWKGYGEKPGVSTLDKEGAQGLLEKLAGGTLFLDELVDVSLEFQILLMQVLDKKEISITTGKDRQFKPDLRLILATNMDPTRAIAEKKLREDLYRRIKNWQITIPALAERKEDIFLFLQAHCPDHQPTNQFCLALLRYSWPGNVGELIDLLKIAKAQPGRNAQELSLENLKLSDEFVEIIKDIKKMTEADAEKEVLSFLATTLHTQGWAKGKGLGRRMAKILNWTESKLSRNIKKVGLENYLPAD